MSRSTEMGIVSPACDLRPGRAQSAELRFSPAGEIAAITLPAGTLGVGIYPSNSEIRFALDNTPGTPTQQPAGGEGVTLVSLTPGALAIGNTWTRRTLPADDREHTLYVLNLSGTTTVNIEGW